LSLLGRAYTWQLIFADDLLWTSHGPDKYLDILKILLFWVMVGTPFSWKKVRGGLSLDWIGYWLDYSRFELGISESRAGWLIKWGQQILGDGLVLVRHMAEGLGRLGFAAGILEWARPFLAPMYAWTAAAPGGAVLPLPSVVRLTLTWLVDQLRAGGRVVVCGQPLASMGELFRADAKGEDNLVVLGGWCCQGGHGTKEARWFSLEVTPAEAPWLFRGANASATISASELLATKLSVPLFAPRGPLRQGVVKLTGGTDNQGNTYIVQKMLTTKMPVAAVLMQLATDLHQAGLWLELNWLPREENTEADALTNGDFSGFDPQLRVPVSWAEVDLGVVQKLLTAEAEFREKLGEHKAARRQGVPEGPARKRKRGRSTWGV